MTRATVFAGLGGLLFGYDTGVIDGALPLIANDFGWDSPFRVGASSPRPCSSAPAARSSRAGSLTASGGAGSA